MFLLRWMCRKRMFLRLLVLTLTTTTVIFFILHIMSQSSHLYSKSKRININNSLSNTMVTTTNSTMLIEGKINIDIWTKTCSVNLNSIRQFPLFPLFPTERHYIKVMESLTYVIKEEFTAMRIMGYLHPPLNGQYFFHLTCPVMSQLWMSTSDRPEDSTKLVYTSRNLVNKQTIHIDDDYPISQAVLLQKGDRYYFEILLAVNDVLRFPGPLVVSWMLPQTAYFSQITGADVSEYSNITSYYKTPDSPVPSTPLPSLQFSETEDKSVGKYYPLDKKRTEESKLPDFTLKQPYIKENLSVHLDLDSKGEVNENGSSQVLIDIHNYSSILNSFSNCTYNPVYTRGRKIKRYDGVWQTFFPIVFPNDGSNLVRFIKPPRSYIDHIQGNHFIKEKDAMEVVKNFMDQANKGPTRSYSLIRILNMELYNPPPIHGEKYLLELLLRNRNNNKIYKFSGFFFRNKDSKDLCFLQNMQWNPHVWIHIILNVKNQPGWLLYFVQEMGRILKASKDKYVNFVVADYGNKGIDIGKEMKRYGIQSYQIFEKTGPFHKTSTINMAASKVTDPNSIVLLMDLHLQFPTNLFEIVRKHTIQGRTGFSPMLMRLSQCGRPRSKHMYPQGFYEPNGFGIFGIYKSDWDKFGGMNEKEFKNKWGGEDWEMVDRVLMRGYEIEKLRLTGFYHFDHDKVGMWT